MSIETPTTSAPRQQKPNLVRRLRPPLLILGIGFFIYFASSSWDTTKTVLQTTALPLFIGSVLLAVIDNILFCQLFNQLLAKNGLTLHWRDVGQMYFFGQFSKYIPGKLWNLVYHATFSSSPGSSKAIIASNIDLTGLAILRNTSLGLSLILYTMHPALGITAFGAGLLLFLIVFRARIAEKFVIWSSRILPGMGVGSPAAGPNTPLSRVALMYCATGTVFTTCNYMLLDATFALQSNEIVLLMAYLSLAWVVGVLAFVIPAGFGVREAAFVLLASQLGSSEQSTATLAAIAVVYRLWQICHEIAGFGIGLALQRMQQRR
jgi:hypothetical protein